MKKIFNNIKENYPIVLIALLIGIAVGWVFFGSSNSASTDQDSHEGHDHEVEEDVTYTCSMHPQIKQNKFGLCPICAMDLIPLTTNQNEGDDVDPNEIVMTNSAAKLAEVETMPVEEGVPEKSVFLQGKIQADERNVSELTARFGGRIEKLYVNFTGQTVKKGEKLATIYSPDLLTAQRELIEAISFKDSRPSLYKAAKAKLRLWDLTERQISNIEKKGQPLVYFDVLSPISGTITTRHVSIGDYVKEGKALFKVIDLSQLWVLFDAYERDLPWIKMEDSVRFTVQAVPGVNFDGKVSYIDPFIDASTRVSKIRVEVDNSDQVLKPEMFVNGTIHSNISGAEDMILIPKTAILWTGKRAVVYVRVPDRESPSFLYREITLGPEAGAFFVVQDGLELGEEIAINGVFKIDAAAQLIGLKSMMNPDGGMPVSGHDHGEMEHDISEMEGDHAKVLVGGNCSMCKDRIEAAALTVDGVKAVEWDADSQELELVYDGSTARVIDVEKAVAEAGHDTENVTAEDEVYEQLHACCKYERLSDRTPIVTVSDSFEVAGNCGMCKDRIEEAALALSGVKVATWDNDTHQLNVEFDYAEISIDEVQKTIAEVGHDTPSYKATNEIYNELHSCCKYERLK